MDEKEECKELLRELRNKYKYEEPDEFSEEDILTRKMKWIITYDLSLADSTIFLLYTETGSLRKLGSIIGVSHSTIRPEVNRIKKEIQNKLIEMKNITNI